jgi:hypothetical protein
LLLFFCCWIKRWIFFDFSEVELEQTRSYHEYH